ncbi:MAG: ABC transporter ATP-binding protein, partial [Chloroflexi bacterium]|nr:ABC transporter ATP-binding protein [Chloroflexota bacterium]
DVSFSVNDNEFVSIVGPSGCGKTTLLKILANLETQDSGTITYSNDQVPESRLIFQDQGLLPWLTVLENIGLGLELKGMESKKRDEKVIAFMDRVKLSGFESHYPHELSGGMRQRVALARAFLTDPDILLMDEPFAALDAQTRIILQEELLSIWNKNKKTVFFVTHDIDEAILLADRVIVMTDRPGKIHADINIKLDRPREITVMDNSEFKRIKWEIWNFLEKEVRKELSL